jgi:hypothetical protein
MSPEARLLAALKRVAPAVADAGAVICGGAAAHAHVAAATDSVPGGPIRYAALVPRRIQVVCPEGAAARMAALGLDVDESPVATFVRVRLDLFATVLRLADGTAVPVLSREAVTAQLLGRGGLSVGLAGLLVRLCRPLDADEVREILKAAGQPERFQPLQELLAVA